METEWVTSEAELLENLDTESGGKCWVALNCFGWVIWVVSLVTAGKFVSLPFWRVIDENNNINS